MCDPITAAGIALSALGTADSVIAQRRAAKNQAKVYAAARQMSARNAEKIRERAAEGNQKIQEMLRQAAPEQRTLSEDAEMAALEARLAERSSSGDAEASPDFILSGQRLAGTEVKENVAKSLADATAAARARIAALARVGSFENVGQQLRDKYGKLGTDIGTSAVLSRGDQALTDFANQSAYSYVPNASPSALGQFASGLGSIALSSGASLGDLFEDADVPPFPARGGAGAPRRPIKFDAGYYPGFGGL